MKITGECHCGKIKYEAEIDLDRVVICHCTDCQILSGTAFRTVAFSKNNAFSLISGVPKIYIKIGDSGNQREQAFCSDCGSSIYSSSIGDDPKEYGIRLGTVNQRNLISPKKQKWSGSSQSWLRDMSSLPVTDTP